MVVTASLGMGRMGYTMLLPSMQKSLGLTNTQTGDIAAGNLCGYLFLAVVGGFLSSHLGPRRVIAVSLIVVGLTMFATGLSRGFLSAVLWRTLTGMGSGGSNVPIMGLLAAWFARKRRGLAMGAAVMGTSVGIIITGALIPFILKTRGDEAWREGWFVLGICALGAGAAAWFLLRNRPGDVGQDPIGMEKGGSAEVQVAKGEDSLHWGRVYRSGVVWHLAMIYSMFGFSYIIYATFFKKYIVTEAGFGETDAGLVWQMVGWLGISCGLTWGWVSDRIGRKWGLAMVYLIQATAFLLFAMGKTAGPIWVSAILFGLTAWSIPAIMAAACGDQLGPRMAPAAIGFVTLFFGIGQAVAPSVAGRIADQTGSFSTAFLCAAAAALLGGTGSLFLRKSH